MDKFITTAPFPDGDATPLELSSRKNTRRGSYRKCDFSGHLPANASLCQSPQGLSHPRSLDTAEVAAVEARSETGPVGPIQQRKQVKCEVREVHIAPHDISENMASVKLF
jgi:hypothetical protein